ncbi:hypothetical protein Tco_0435419 [Tanacetum coccineum]
MDDPNITMEEYIRLEKEKAQKRGIVFNWESAKYGKIWNDEDIHDLRSIETEFPAIAFNDEVSSKHYLMNPRYVLLTIRLTLEFRLTIPTMKTTRCFDDLDFFKDFENEFPAIVYNDALTSKSDLLTEPILNPQHIEEFDLKNETSLFGYNEEEQIVLYFNDLFPFNLIRPDDLKSANDNDDNDIDIIQSLEDMAPLPPREQRKPFLRHQGLGYTDADIVDFEESLERIYSREIHKLGGARRRLSWRQFILALGLHTGEEMESLRFARMMAHSIAGRSQAPEKVTVTDLFYLRGMDVGLVNIPYLSAQYLRMFTAGRKSGAHISGGQFVARLTEHFGLLAVEILAGLTLISPELTIIDMVELVRLQICEQLDDTWVWVDMGPERQPDAATGPLGVAQDAPIVDEGGQADPAPVHVSPPPLASARTMPQRWLD